MQLERLLCESERGELTSDGTINIAGRMLASVAISVDKVLSISDMKDKS